jgi:hypothetical protein
LTTSNIFSRYYVTIAFVLLGIGMASSIALTVASLDRLDLIEQRDAERFEEIVKEGQEASLESSTRNRELVKEVRDTQDNVLRYLKKLALLAGFDRESLPRLRSRDSSPYESRPEPSSDEPGRSERRSRPQPEPKPSGKPSPRPSPSRDDPLICVTDICVDDPLAVEATVSRVSLGGLAWVLVGTVLALVVAVVVFYIYMTKALHMAQNRIVMRTHVYAVSAAFACLSLAPIVSYPLLYYVGLVLGNIAMAAVFFNMRALARHTRNVGVTKR